MSTTQKHTTGIQDDRVTYTQTLADESYDAAACSHAETGYYEASQAHAAGYEVDKKSAYQLQQWVYENWDGNITFSERLEKSKWSERRGEEGPKRREDGRN
jgi:hypothetical protein